MTFTDAITTCFRKYATFSGRAPRSEYWWFVLFVVLVTMVLGFVDASLFGAPSETEPGGALLVPIWQLATLIPLLAAAWRRMHDTGRSGKVLLIPLAISFGLSAMLLLGIVGADVVGVDAADPAATSLALGGLGVMAVAMIVQLVVGILLLWWLTRPSQPDTNEYGPPPAEARV